MSDETFQADPLEGLVETMPPSNVTTVFTHD